MAAPLPTVQQAIDGLYIVLYGRTADSLGYTAWSSYLGLTQTQIAAQQATAAQYQSLANAFISGEPTYYNATYPSTMTNTQFVNALVGCGAIYAGVSVHRPLVAGGVGIERGGLCGGRGAGVDFQRIAPRAPPSI
jgi:hypothetical protein